MLSLAAVVSSAPHLAFPTTQVWTLVIGALVPLLSYVVNHFAPWASEQAKAVFLLIVSAGGAALYTALSTNVIGFNDATLQLVLSGVIAALAAHGLLWRPSGISAKLGGGSNAARRPHRRLGWISEPPAEPPAA